MDGGGGLAVSLLDSRDGELRVKSWVHKHVCSKKALCLRWIPAVWGAMLMPAEVTPRCRLGGVALPAEALSVEEIVSVLFSAQTDRFIP